MLYEHRMFIFDPMLMIWPGLAIAAMTLLLSRTFARTARDATEQGGRR